MIDNLDVQGTDIDRRKTAEDEIEHEEGEVDEEIVVMPMKPEEESEEDFVIQLMKFGLFLGLRAEYE